MTKDQFDAAYRAFCRRRPFRPFLIEFLNGNQLLIGHPEAVRSEPKFYVTLSRRRLCGVRGRSRVAIARSAEMSKGINAHVLLIGPAALAGTALFTMRSNS
jgi:hypothetical protein